MGGLTTHVLDTAQGKPGAGIPLTLYRIGAQRELLASTVTNPDGRTDQPLLEAQDCQPGTYELTFSVAQYFQTSATSVEAPSFLDDITLRFTLTDDSHYHVPLLVSPWSYTTYRGS